MASISLFTKSLYSVLKKTTEIETKTQNEIPSVLDELILMNHERSDGYDNGLLIKVFRNSVPGNV